MSPWRCLLQLWLGLGLLAPARAQDLRFLHHQAWSVEQGLPQSSVHDVLQSRDGYVWAATEGGVARFDGVSFRVFGHETAPAFSSDDVCCIAQDATGAVWFGTADGLVRLRDGRFAHVGESEGLPAAGVLALATGSGGELLALTAGGPVRWTGDRFEPVWGSGDVVALGRKADGTALLLGSGGVAALAGGTVTSVPEGGGLPAGRWTGVEGGMAAALWLRSPELVALRAGGVTHVWRTGRELPGSRVESLRVDRAGAAWVGTNGGLAVVRPDTSQVTPIAAMDGNTVLSVTEDMEGNHWVGTDAGGLHLLRALPFRSVAPLADKAVTSVVEATDEAVWVGTREDGLRRMRDGVVTEPAAAGSLTSPVILSLAPGAMGSVWAGTPDGLNHVGANGAVRRYTSANGLPDDDVRSLAEDDDGSVWIGTRRGLAHLAGDRVQTLTRADGLGSDLVGTLLKVRVGRAAGLWIGTSGGLSFRGNDGRLRTFGARDGLSGQIVTGMAQDRARALWVATGDGALARNDGARFQAVQVFSTADRVAGIAIDGRDGLWARTARGVWRVAIADVLHCLATAPPCAAERVRYGLADGLPSEEMVAGGSPALWRSMGGTLWVATRRGLAAADAEHLPSNRVEPPVVIERFAVDDRTLPLEGGAVSLPYGHDRFTMEYAGLSFVAPSKVRYRVKLVGFDAAWTEAGARRSATYTNLPPGRYTFRVQAMNNDGVWSSVGAQLGFRIVPPWYRRWWFLLLCALALAGTVYAVIWLRLRRVRREFAAVLGERTRIAREIHDTLAQDFVGVSIQLEIASQMLNAAKPDAASAQLERARQLVREGIADARESIWELRANTAQDSLPTRLTRLADRYVTPATAVRAAITGAYRALGAETENEVLRVAQEALTNVEKHAGASVVDVALAYGRDGIELAISDNGRGFAPRAVPQGHYGLRGMRERSAELGGALEIEERPGGGTTVRLRAPTGAAGKGAVER